MEYKLLGLTFRLEIVAICLLIGILIGTSLLCSCKKVSIKEGLETLGANVDYVMGNDIASSWVNKVNSVDGGSYQNPWNKYNDIKGTPVPLKDGQLNFFADNKFDSSCCPSTYSDSMGCACMSREQVDYLNERGGNRSIPPSEF